MRFCSETKNAYLCFVNIDKLIINLLKTFVMNFYLVICYSGGQSQTPSQKIGLREDELGKSLPKILKEYAYVVVEPLYSVK